MPEYLAPGVFVEEMPPALRAVEGVSTSTAAMIGPTERGPVAGGALPFTPTGGFSAVVDPAPVLVTSMGEFVRQFGPPLRLPADTDAEDRGYLGHGVKAFFDNGGRRVYVARVVAGATWNTLRVGQGVVLRLQRSARAGDTSVELTSLRGISVGTGLTFLRRSDGTNALVTAATAAAMTGTVPAPFALQVGDTIAITVTGSPAVNMTPVAAAPVDLASNPAAPTFNIAPGDTLDVQVGGPGSEIQTALFGPDDVATAGDATATEVALVLARDLKGVSVSIDGSDAVHLISDVSGTAAAIAVVGGAANAALGYGSGNGTGNVADVDQVTFDEIVSLIGGGASGVFTLSSTPTGALRLISVATGVGVTLAVTGAPAALTALGLAGPSTPGAGGGAAPAVSVSAYDTPHGVATLNAALPTALGKNDVYVEVSSAPVSSPAVGPVFHARSPGSWSRGLEVTLSPVDRAPVPIVLAAGPTATTVQVQSATSFYVGAIVEIDHDGLLRSTHEVMGITGTTLTLTPAMSTGVLTVPGATSYARVLELDVVVVDTTGAAPTETWRGLSWNPRSTAAIRRRHYATQINNNSRLVYVQPPGIVPAPLTGSEDADIATQPTTTTGFGAALSDTAVDGIPTADDAGHQAIAGIDNGPGQRTGIESLVDVPDVRLVLVPGQTSDTVALALIAHCERMRYRFAVIDGRRDPVAGSITDILAHRELYDTSYAAYYAPWVAQVVDGESRFLPPSPFAAGIYARVDNARGVWKAPANETVQNVRGLRTRFTTGEQEVLNPRGVNLIRQFDQGGIRIWGARTMSSDPSVKYINVRRTLIFLEASIDAGTQWVVFEPNTPATWTRVTETIRSFLTTQWREGALFGRTEEAAFFVRCDESTMTADDVFNGRLICRIGVAIVRPAEFVIFRIEQLTGFAAE